jgi:hypothetical protein
MKDYLLICLGYIFLFGAMFSIVWLYLEGLKLIFSLIYGVSF